MKRKKFYRFFAGIELDCFGNSKLTQYTDMSGPTYVAVYYHTRRSTVLEKELSIVSTSENSSLN